MMEGLFIKNEHLPIGMGSKGQLAHGQTIASGVGKGKMEEEGVEGRQYTKILADDIEASYHCPTIWMQLGRSGFGPL